MIPSGFPWKVVIFFGKEHVIWSNISGVMIMTSPVFLGGYKLQIFSYKILMIHLKNMHDYLTETIQIFIRCNQHQILSTHVGWRLYLKSFFKLSIITKNRLSGSKGWFMLLLLLLFTHPTGIGLNLKFWPISCHVNQIGLIMF